MGMKKLTLADIARVTGGVFYGREEEKELSVTGVVTDNRHVKPGNLFLCIPGEKHDGHRFAASAFENGAVACLAQKPLECGPYILVESTLRAIQAIGKYYRSLFSIPVIGVTGSVGKTTAKEMTAAVLGAGLNVLKTSANLNNELGVPLTLLRLQEEHQAAVVEMGISEFGEMTRLSDMVRPDLCIMTTIGYCHLENLGDLDGVLRAKSEVYQHMPSTGTSIVCGDDEKLRAFDPGLKKITYGFGSHNDYRASQPELHGTDGITFCVTTPTGRLDDVFVPAFGQHMALSALAAIAAAQSLGLSNGQILQGLRAYAPVGGRANVKNTGYLTVINDCYNANPNSVTASLASLASLEGRTVAILGDMNELGQQEKQLHRLCGHAAAEKGIDLTVCCGPLSENTYHGCLEKGGRALWFPSREELIQNLSSLVQRGDTVLVKASHSHHFEEIVQELEKLS